MNAPNPRAVIGGNEPPLGERLALDHADLVKRAKEAVELVPDAIRPIANDEEADAYTQTAADLKKIEKEGDDAFTPEKKPWLDGGKAVDDFFRFRATLKAKADLVVKAINTYQTAKLNAQRAADAAAAEKARKEAEAFDETPVYVAPTVVKEATRVVAFSGAKASGSVKWEYRVTDFAKLADQFKLPNDPALKAAVSTLKALGGDIKDAKIEGIEIFEAVKTAIRR